MLDPATRLGVAVPVPPLATAKVPPNVIGPVVAVAGVKPVVPPLKEATPVVIAAICVCTNAVVAICVVFVFTAAVVERGVPVNVGLAERTVLPVPVEVVTPVPPCATGSVPVTPVVKGKPVAFVNVADVGVPKTGVTSVGEVDNTVLPEPVEVVTPVPPLATGSVPVTWEVKLTPDSAPPRVRLPVLVTVPVRVIPLTVPVPLTLVTPSATLEATLT
jgi:hypothetical protein